MATTLLIISIVLLTYLSGYALMFVALSLFAYFSDGKTKLSSKKSLPSENHGAISVLIPSHNEGEGLIDAVETVLKQDYSGPIDVYILLNNKKYNPTEIAALAKFYKFDSSELDNQAFPNIITIFNNNKRKIHLALTGIQSKKEKINYILPLLKQPLTAILDADHRPSSNWLSSSVNILFAPVGINGKKEVVAVQTRRKPLSTNHLAQIWDSSQAHLGNELFNNFLTKVFKRNTSVFFTGTAALFKTNILKKYGLSNSVTEDTYLSYDLLCDGYAIAYNSDSVSYEEVSPSFRDYVNRRRRWSAGHSQTFFSHIVKIFKSKLSFYNKLIILFHGQFYLIPLIIWLLLSIYGYYFFRQIEVSLQLVVAIITFITAGILSYSFRQKGRFFLGDFFVAFIWLLPQFFTFSIYYYKFAGLENYYYILIFPYAKNFIFWHIGLIAAPLIVFIASFYYFKDSRQSKILWVIPTYVFMMALDVYAALLGFWDMITGRSYWSRITRSNAYSSNLVEPTLSSSFVTGKTTKPSRKMPYIIAAISITGLFVLNNLLAVNNCGIIKSFLWKPFFMQPKQAIDLKISVDKKLGINNDLNVNIYTSLSGDSGNYLMKYFIDNELIGQNELAGEFPDEPIKIIDKNFPLGWQMHDVQVELQGQNGEIKTKCINKTSFSTVLKELRDKDLFINNEKFLIKGIIPSFMNNQIGLELSDGLKQFHDIGVNTIRLYHSASSLILTAAEKSQLLIINQPYRSNWSELNVLSERQVDNYIDRYKKMVSNHMGQPYILIDGLGNEWELGNTAETNLLVKATSDTLFKATETVSNWPTSYSTYFTFIDYPTDINAVNMLDTGSTYWDKGLQVIKDSNKPFYASEFGGFVASVERTVPEIRMNRMEYQWSTLLQNGALGANFYESHDNWAQSVVFGYNDPFKDEHPDDLRGFWDHNNKPKPELRVLKQILSDLEVKVENETIANNDNQINLIIKNIREYSLQGVNLESQNNTYELGSFNSKEEKKFTIKWNLNEKDSEILPLRFSYTTHSGLGSASQVDLHLPILKSVPLVLNKDFLLTDSSEIKLSGKLISSDKLDLIIPGSWNDFSLNGQPYSKTNSRMEIPVLNPYHTIPDLEISQDGINWYKLGDDHNLGKAEYYLRFYWPNIPADKQYLVLSDVGSGYVQLSWKGENRELEIHSYRENVIDFSDLKNLKPGELLTIRMFRNETSYIDKNLADNYYQVGNSLKGNVNIDFELPIIFAPINIKIEKNN